MSLRLRSVILSRPGAYRTVCRDKGAVLGRHSFRYEFNSLERKLDNFCPQGKRRGIRRYPRGKEGHTEERNGCKRGETENV